MVRIFISLSKEQFSALIRLSKAEFRPVRDQAALIIQQELRRHGLVSISGDLTSTSNLEEVQAQAPGSSISHNMVHQ